MVNRDSVVVRKTDLVAAQADPDLIILSIERGNYYSLRDTGRNVWDEIKSPISVHTLVDRLCSSYDIRKEDCLNDVLPFLEELYEEGIIEVQLAAAAEAQANRPTTE